MKTFKYFIPNTITSINLLAGILACIFAFEDTTGNLSIFFILVAALADLLDGMVAKLLNASSEFGKQLDSLADVVSFGVAPSFLMYRIMQMAFVKMEGGSFEMESPLVWQRLILYASFFVAVFAALRLARLNITESKDTDFKGMPVPASALFVLSIWMVLKFTDSDLIQSIILNLFFLLGVIVFLCFMMVSNIPMLSFKFKNFSFSDNIWRYSLIAGIFILYIILGQSSLFFIMIYYFILSVFKALIA
jgi:CDP-diacylglycerol--serine O-phosphatidyltransferase